MAFCGECGNDIASRFCTNCGASNHILDVNPASQILESRKFFNRTPFQVFVLDSLSFGGYSVFWLIRNRRLAEINIGMKPMKYTWWILLFIPFVNAFIFYTSFNIICRSVRKDGINPPVPFGIQAILFTFLTLLWRLPDPYWIVCCLSSVLLGTMQVSLWNAEYRSSKFSLKALLSKWEIGIIIACSILVLLAIFGSLQGSEKSSWLFIACVVATLLAFGCVFYFLGSDKFSKKSVL